MSFSIVASAAALVITGCAHAPLAVYEPPQNALYLTPLVSPGTKFAALPPAVQNTVRAETGSAEIEDIVRDNVAGQVIYRIYFTKSDVFPPLNVAADGSVLNPDMTVSVGAGREFGGSLVGRGASGVALGDLPPDVVRTIQGRAPNAEISSIGRENRGDQAVYIVTFKDPKQPILTISPEGKLVPPAPIIQVPDRRRQ